MTNEMTMEETAAQVTAEIETFQAGENESTCLENMYPTKKKSHSASYAGANTCMFCGTPIADTAFTCDSIDCRDMLDG